MIRGGLEAIGVCFASSPWKRVSFKHGKLDFPDEGFVPRGYKGGGRIETKIVRPIIGKPYHAWRYDEPQESEKEKEVELSIPEWIVLEAAVKVANEERRVGHPDD